MAGADSLTRSLPPGTHARLYYIRFVFSLNINLIYLSPIMDEAYCEISVLRTSLAGWQNSYIDKKIWYMIFF